MKRRPFKAKTSPIKDVFLSEVDMCRRRLFTCAGISIEFSCQRFFFAAPVTDQVLESPLSRSGASGKGFELGKIIFLIGKSQDKALHY